MPFNPLRRFRGMDQLDPTPPEPTGVDTDGDIDALRLAGCSTIAAGVMQVGYIRGWRQGLLDCAIALFFVLGAALASGLVQINLG